MTTTVNVTASEAGGTVTTILHNPDGDRETEAKLAPFEPQAFVIHNTLSLRLTGAMMDIDVKASEWPVRVITGGNEDDPVAPGDSANIVLDDGETMELTERPAPAGRV